jgi:S-(hydroxymethyl)glutathione dehydrogenase/alcohol dehydrogenase
MGAEMRAALLLEYGAPLQVEEVEPAPLGRRDARVQIDASGVCRTDLRASRGSLGRPLPLLLGHEATGIVTGVGRDVSRVEIGDRVVLSFIAACGNCAFCLRPDSHLCGYLEALAGLPKATRRDGTPVFATSALGTFAEEITAHETLLVKVSTDLPSEELALIGCGVMTGIGAVLNTAVVEPGSSVAVFGCGGVGQAVIQGARVAGAADIFAVDPVQQKRDLALANGATLAIDPGVGDSVDQVREATAGAGCDYAFEVLGTCATVLQTLRATRRGGTSVVVGMPHPGDIFELPLFDFFVEAKHLVACIYGSAQVRRDIPRTVRLVETGQLNLSPLVSRRVGLENINDAFAALEAGEVLRSVVTPAQAGAPRSTSDKRSP